MEVGGERGHSLGRWLQNIAEDPPRQKHPSVDRGAFAGIGEDAHQIGVGEDAGPMAVIEPDGDEVGSRRKIDAVERREPAVEGNFPGGEQTPVVGRPVGREKDVVDEQPEARPQIVDDGGVEPRMAGGVLGDFHGPVDAQPGEEESTELRPRPPIAEHPPHARLDLVRCGQLPAGGRGPEGLVGDRIPDAERQPGGGVPRGDPSVGRPWGLAKEEPRGGEREEERPLERRIEVGKLVEGMPDEGP